VGESLSTLEGIIDNQAAIDHECDTHRRAATEPARCLQRQVENSDVERRRFTRAGGQVEYVGPGALRRDLLQKLRLPGKRIDAVDRMKEPGEFVWR
jgi:hypothetical protein